MVCFIWFYSQNQPSLNIRWLVVSCLTYNVIFGSHFEFCRYATTLLFCNIINHQVVIWLYLLDNSNFKIDLQCALKLHALYFKCEKNDFAMFSVSWIAGVWKGFYFCLTRRCTRTTLFKVITIYKGTTPRWKLFPG